LPGRPETGQLTSQLFAEKLAINLFATWTLVRYLQYSSRWRGGLPFWLLAAIGYWLFPKLVVGNCGGFDAAGARLQKVRKTPAELTKGHIRHA
jgi:hypothetical protein